MNGRAAKRIRWAAYRIVTERFPRDTPPPMQEFVQEFDRTISRLKRAYYAKPYHLRDVGPGIRSLSHREERERWKEILNNSNR